MYALDCPACGGQLQPHVGEAQSCPWLCNNCHLGFWTAELQPGTRAHYRPHLKDWGWGAHIQPLRLARLTEFDEAKKRGSSAREDQLAMLDVTSLNGILTRPKLEQKFKVHVQNEVTRREVR